MAEGKECQYRRHCNYKYPGCPFDFALCPEFLRKRSRERGSRTTPEPIKRVLERQASRDIMPVKWRVRRIE